MKNNKNAKGYSFLGIICILYMLPIFVKAQHTAELIQGVNPPRLNLRTTSFNSNNPSGIVGLAASANNFCPGSAVGDLIVSNNNNKSIIFGLGSFSEFSIPSNTYLERMRITPDGKIGIGISIPTSSLHVQSGTSTSTFKLHNTAGTNVGVDFLTYSTATVDAKIARIQANDMLNWNGSLSFHTKGDGVQNGGTVTERMRITHDGKVGIGTSAPGTNLAVAGTKILFGASNILGTYGATQTVTELQSSDAAFVNLISNIQVDGKANSLSMLSASTFGYAGINIGTRNSATALPFTISHGAKEQLRILPTGNIGIGTTTPQSALELANAGAAYINLNSNSGSPGNNSGIRFQTSGSNAQTIEYNTYSGCGSGGMHIGSVVNTSTDKRMHLYPTRIIFSNNATYGNCGGVGLSNTYTFDADLGATSMLVSPATSTPYPTIPAGYIFSVNAGNANINGHLRISSSASILPDNTRSGSTFGNATGVGGVNYSWIQTSESMPLALNPIPNSNPGTTNTSYVAIGFKPGDYPVPNKYKLAVKGNIICEELLVKLSNDWTWPDFVFDGSYKLKSLSEVESYIKTNKHLPDVPSAQEVKETGIESAKMDATLLKKIEELTLYMIAQQKQMDEQKAEIEVLKKQNTQLLNQK